MACLRARGTLASLSSENLEILLYLLGKVHAVDTNGNYYSMQRGTTKVLIQNVQETQFYYYFLQDRDASS